MQLKPGDCDRQLDSWKGPHEGNGGPVKGTDGPVRGTDGPEGEPALYQEPDPLLGDDPKQFESRYV